MSRNNNHHHSSNGMMHPRYRNNNNNVSTAPHHGQQQAISADVKHVTVIDPAFRSGKIQIPIDRTMPTKGRDEWLQGALRNKDLSLCCLFQRGRCHAQERCHQVHVDRDFMSALREQQSSIVSCCRHCRDTATMSSSAMSFLATYVPSNAKVHVTLNNEGTQYSVIDADRLAFTAGLVQQFEEHGCRAINNVIGIPLRRVCRLHMKSACKYGKDCKNVHVCCQFSDYIVIPAQEVEHSKIAIPAVARVASAPPQKETTSTFSKIVTTPAQPLPSFTVPSVVIVGGALPVPADSCDSSKSCLSVDPVDITENSGRLRGIIFDAFKCMEDSANINNNTNQPSSCKAEEESNFSYFSTSPGQKRRSSNTSTSTASSAKALHLGAWHPCSKAVEPVANAPSRISQFDQFNFFKLFQ